MKHRDCRVWLLALAGAFAAGTSPAFQFDAGAVKGSIDSTLTSGFGYRLLDQDNSLVGDPSQGGTTGGTYHWSNGDNGDLNYDKGDFFAGYLKGTHDVVLSFPWGFKFMARGTWLGDVAATNTDRTDLSGPATRQVARDSRLLDLWVSKQFNLGPQNARVRLGNQVVSWGESLFTPGGINSTNALDIQKLLVPGTQLKEAVIPAPIVSFASGLGGGLNVEAYYQFKWNESRLPPVGSYFSTADFLGKGKDMLYIGSPIPPTNPSAPPSNSNFGGVDAAYVASQAHISVKDARQQLIYSIDVNGAVPVYSFESGLQAEYGTFGIPFRGDNKAREDGQYGVALHYKPTGVKVDLGFYFMNYHDKTPNASVVADKVVDGVVYPEAQLRFLEDRKLYGVSANFPVGDLAMGWELSYRPKDAVALTGCFNPGGPLDANTNPSQTSYCEQWIDREKYQMALTGILSLTPGYYGWALDLLGADTATLLAEVVGIRYVGVSPHTKYTRTTKDGYTVVQAPSANLNFWQEGDITGSEGTEYSAGYTIDFSWVYDGKLIPGWQVQPGITFTHAAIGDTPTAGPTYLNANKATNLYILFNKNPATWQAGINYAAFFGDNMRQPLKDRDFIGGFVSYNF